MESLLLPTAALLSNTIICPENFVPLGNFCYHFSDVEASWDVARGVCRGIGSIHNEYIIPAVLDFGSAEDNQLLLNEVRRMNNTYWLGGHLEENRWQWIFNKDKDIDTSAHYWIRRLPEFHGNYIEVSNETENCEPKMRSCVKTAKETSVERVYIESVHYCDEKLKVICQIIPGYFGFRDVGKGKFYFSTSKGNWNTSRNECRSMSPPENYDYVDLASSLDPDTDQQLLKIIAQNGHDAWLGGYSEKNESIFYDYRWNGDSREYNWIDERPIDRTSYFLDVYFEENYSDLWQTMVTFASINYDGKPRATIRACFLDHWKRKKYVCQAYKN